MGKQYGFNYTSAKNLSETAAALGADIPISETAAALLTPYDGAFHTDNRLVVHPMEGSDGIDSAPSPLTRRRYLRYAAGGAGLIWMEAVAVTPQGRSSARQLMLTKENLPMYCDLLKQMRQTAAENGVHSLILLQLTHSGRYSKPEGYPAPVTAWHHRTLDLIEKVSPDHQPASDEELAALPSAFAYTAMLAREAGFDGVDIKACHLYLYSELLGTAERPGIYGGNLENRARLFLQTVDAVSKAVGRDYLLATRLNIYDGIDNGFGGDSSGMALDEPVVLLKKLTAAGVPLINITMGVPRSLPYINRPYASGGMEPKEHPLVGVARLIQGANVLQKAVPKAAIVGTGYSYLRQYGPLVGDAVLRMGGASLIGFGRQSFAYPEFGNDLRDIGRFDEKKVCLTCCLCSKLMAGGKAGCPIRDKEVYGTILKESIR